MINRRSLASLALVVLPLIAPAQEVWITKNTAAKTSVDLTGLRATSGGGALFVQTVQNDLLRSGWFNIATPATFSVRGTATVGADLSAACELLDNSRNRALLNKTYADTAAGTRHQAHHAADDIIFAATGKKGMNGARLLLTGRRSSEGKEIFLCDTDGANLRQLTHDNSISLAPQWAPNGETFVYTSYRRNNFQEANLVDLRTNQRSVIAAYSGIDMCGGIAPDGGSMLLVLSKDGNPDIYIQGLNGGTPIRLTKSAHAGQASPCWSPDGNAIAYVSDRAGSPQLYVMSRSGGGGRLLTSRGSQNVAPDWGNEGIAYCSRRGGRYVICVINPATREDRQISPSDCDYEDPSWAPDGRHIFSTRTTGYRSSICMLDTMGDAPLSLSLGSGDWTSPACTR
ncbi:MAG: hypothetical protein WCL16_03500 [bacterium]